MAKKTKTSNGLRIALAQINPLLGDFNSNSEKILSSIQLASEKHCDLVVFPEAALFGYHPVDLLEQPQLVKLQEKHLTELSKKIKGNIVALVGAMTPNKNKLGKPFFNSAVLLSKGKKPVVFSKQLLPTYDVFDEGRHIEPGKTAENFFKLKGKNILVTICEDIWAWPMRGSHRFQSYGSNPLQKIPKSKVDLVVNLSASPFTLEKLKLRQQVVQMTAKQFSAPVVYVNMVGAQDELIFDGGSFAIDKSGKILAQAVRFEEDFSVIDFSKLEGSGRKLLPSPKEDLRKALVLGIRDFVAKTGFSKVHLGVSGGIDSALVACLAVDALGPENVRGILLPGPFTSDLSNELGRQLCENLGIGFETLSITSPLKNLNFKGLEGLVHENAQARLRGLLLMAIANRDGSLLLGTSNKSELAVGYSTLYGDLCGALLPIGDLLKGQVYELSRFYNEHSELIPKGVIERPPTAELRENQKDEDSLPPYPVLDSIVKNLVEDLKFPKSELEIKIYQMMMKSEFKRWQAPPILKVSTHAFGRGRRLPIASKISF